MKLNLTEEWCMAAAAREGDSEVGAGGMSSDFDLLIAGLQHWRNEDHADNLNLNRHQICTLLDGIGKHLPGVAQPEQEPVAFVPVHPRNGPLWSDTYATTSFSERSPNYPRMALYAAQPPAAPVETDAMEGELDTVVQLIHKHVDVRDLFDGAQELTGVEAAAKAILAALSRSSADTDKAKALATRIENALSVSVIEQYQKPGPVWAMPLNDDDVALIVRRLRDEPQTSGNKEGGK